MGDPDVRKMLMLYSGGHRPKDDALGQDSAAAAVGATVGRATIGSHRLDGDDAAKWVNFPQADLNEAEAADACA